MSKNIYKLKASRMSKSTETKTKRVSLVLFYYNEVQKENSSSAYKYKGEQEGKEAIQIKLHSRTKRPTDRKQDSAR